MHSTKVGKVLSKLYLSPIYAVVVSEQCSHLMAEATTKLNFVLLEDVLRMINSTSVINKSSELELVNDLITGKCDIGGGLGETLAVSRCIELLSHGSVNSH